MANRYYDPKKVNQAHFDANAAYSLSGFEVERPRPSYEEEERRYRKPDLKVADQPQQKTKAEIRSEEVRSYKVSAKVVAVALILFAMLAAVLYGENMKNQLTHEIAGIEKKLDIANSENTRLNMQLNALVSIDKIEQYATEQLGMVKLNKYQIAYVNTADAKAAQEKKDAEPVSEDAQNQAGTAPGEDAADTPTGSGT